MDRPAWIERWEVVVERVQDERDGRYLYTTIQRASNPNRYIHYLPKSRPFHTGPLGLPSSLGLRKWVMPEGRSLSGDLGPRIRHQTPNFRDPHGNLTLCVPVESPKIVHIYARCAITRFVGGSGSTYIWGLTQVENQGKGQQRWNYVFSGNLGFRCMETEPKSCNPWGWYHG